MGRWHDRYLYAKYKSVPEVGLKGLDLSREYYSRVIKPLIEDRLPEVSAGHAAALIGWGSDVLCNDDELSRDHEWGPRCIIFLPDPLSRLGSELFSELNAGIGPSFMGFPTRFMVDEDRGFRLPSSDGLGDAHIEVTTCMEYFSRNLGVVTPASELEWLSVPEHRLLELTGGEVFFDGTGELTALREFYQAYYPPNVWKYRLAYAWQSLAWDIDLIGLCDSRGDLLSTRNCLSVTLLNVIKLTFLQNRRYSHAYPKWFGKEFYKLPHLSDSIGPVLESCHLDTDIASILGKLESVCDLLIKHQDGLDGLPKTSTTKTCQLGRGFWRIDLQHVADQIRGSIDGPLRTIPLYGAIDQWVINQDLLLDSSILRRLSAVYGARGNAQTPNVSGAMQEN